MMNENEAIELMEENFVGETFVSNKTGSEDEITAARVKNGHPHVHVRYDDFNKEWIHLEKFKEWYL